MTILCYNVKCEAIQGGQGFLFGRACSIIKSVVILPQNKQFCVENRTQDKAKNLAFCVASHLTASWVRFFVLDCKMKKRSNGYSSKTTWIEMVSIYGRLCAYCLEEPAQSIDHVIPWSYSYDSSIENLRPCCLWCNLHAGDKMFASFDEKQAYLIRKRNGGRSRASRTVCTTCFLPYQRPHMTTSLFECPACDPSKSNEQQIREWKSFLELMRSAGIRPDLHAEIRARARDGVSSKNLRMQLGQLYIDSILGVDSDQMTVADLSFLGVKI